MEGERGRANSVLQNGGVNPSKIYGAQLQKPNVNYGSYAKQVFISSFPPSPAQMNGLKWRQRAVKFEELKKSFACTTLMGE